MKYQAVLFDFDGTLANDLSYFVKAYDYALQKYSLSLSPEEIASTCFNKDEEEIAEKLGLPSGVEFRKYYFEGIRKRFTDVPLFNGVVDLFKLLKKNGVKIGLISFAHRWHIGRMLEQTKIASYFQSVVTFNDVIKPKPDPEAIFISCKKLGIDINEVVSIGDARGDILMGNAAGCDTVLFLPKDNESYYNFSELRKLNPTYEIASYNEFLNLMS